MTVLERRMTERNMSTRHLLVLAMLLVGLTATSCSSPARAERPAQPELRLHQVLADFDACRELAMRALINAQDLKCVYLYGRGWGLDMPEAVAEDTLIEGLWLFDYLYSMDDTSLSMFSYMAVPEHPDLAEELAAFEAFLPEAAAKTLAYYQKTSAALAAAKKAVNEAAAKKAAFTMQTLPAQPVADAMMREFGGDGFRLGWYLPVLAPDGIKYQRYLKQHGLTNEWMLRQAAAAGLEFIAPWDRNVFDWPDVEKVEGKYDWSRVDEVLGLLKKHGLGVWLPVRANCMQPPDWLMQRLGDGAVLKGPDGKPLEVTPNIGDSAHFGVSDARQKVRPANMFEPYVQVAFNRYVSALMTRVKQSGVKVVAVELGDRAGLPYYAGPEAEQRFRNWLQARRPGTDVSQVKLPATPKPEDAKDAAQRKLLLDVVRWREEEHVEFFTPLAHAVRAVAPETPICVQSCEMAEFNESMDGRHNERLTRTLRAVPYHFSSGENIWDDLRRCYSGWLFSGCGTHTGSGNSFAQYAMSSYVHDSLVMFTMPTPFARGFYWGDCYFYPDLRWRWSSMFGWKRFQQRAQRMAPEMLNARVAPQVAMLWSDTSSKQQSFTQDFAGGTYGFWPAPANYHKVECIGWDRILNSLDIAYDFVTEGQARAGALSRFKMLIMPSAQALPADVCERVRQFVNDGGIAIATSAPGLFNDQLEQAGRGQLADVFGAEFDRFVGASIVAETPMTQPIWNEPLFEPWLGRNDQKAKMQSDSLKNLYCTFKPAQGAQVLERFTSDDPAVILNSFGKGRAVVIGYPIGRESFLSDIYHEHYGHNWADWPNGTTFQQGIFRWMELLLPQVGFEREALVTEEIVPRAVGQDAGWPCWQFTRKGGSYSDYVWKTGRSYDGTVNPGYGEPPPRSVELSFRRAEGNPNAYMLVFNREGAYGHDPGAVHFEATSKELKIELNRTDVKHVYDSTLGCAVPTAVEKRVRGGAQVTTLRTMIEPSMARMLVVAADDTVRLYDGNREHGGVTEAALREAVSRLAQGNAAPQQIIIGPDKIVAFLAERGRKGIIISCESPTYEPAAEKLAAEMGKAFGKKVRVSRNSPRIRGSQSGLGVWRAEANTFIEQPDILLGSHNESHSIAAQVISPGFSGHTQPLTVMPSHTFPGPGRCIIALTRPFRKKDAQGEQARDRIFVEEPAPQKLLVGASDAGGLEAGVSSLVKLVRQAGKQVR